MPQEPQFVQRLLRDQAGSANPDQKRMPSARTHLLASGRGRLVHGIRLMKSFVEGSALTVPDVNDRIEATLLGGTTPRLFFDCRGV